MTSQHKFLNGATINDSDDIGIRLEEIIISDPDFYAAWGVDGYGCNLLIINHRMQLLLENSRYHHQKDLVGGRCTLTKVGLFKAVISSNDVYCLGVLERSHMMPIIMRLTFKYSFQEGTQIRPRFVEFLSSSDTSSPEAQALKIELMKAQSELGENVI